MSSSVGVGSAPPGRSSHPHSPSASWRPDGATASSTCRWTRMDPGRRPKRLPAAHVPGGIFLDLETELASEPGRGGRHRWRREAFAGAVRPRGIDRDTQVVRTAHRAPSACGGSCAPLRPRRVLRLIGGIEAWGGGAREAARRRSSRPDSPPPAPVTRRRRTRLRLASTTRGSCSSTPGRPGDSAASRTRSTWSRAASLPPATSPWEEPLPPLPDGDVIAYCGSGVTACVVLHRSLGSPGGPGACTPARGARGEQRPELPRARGQGPSAGSARRSA